MLKLTEILVFLRLLNIKFLACLFFPFILSGQSFTIYNYFNSPVPDNRVNCLQLDSSNTLWVGTQYGLVTYDGVFWQDLSDSINNPVVRDISIDNKGSVWVATNSGFCKYDSVWNYFSPPFQALLEQINCIAFDSEDDPWFGTVNGLFSYKNDSFNLVMDTSSLGSFLNVGSIEFKGDSIIVGTVNGGIGFIYNNSCSWLNLSPIGGIIDNSFNDLLLDEENNLWGCSPYGGLQVLFSNGSWYFINTISNPGWHSNSISSIYIDSTNKKYLGTKGGGVIIFEYGPNVFNTIIIDSSNSNLPDDFILDVVYNNGVLWIATQFEGLVKTSIPVMMENEFYKNPKIYPSVFNKKINVVVENPCVCNIYDISGNLVFQDNLYHTIELDLDFLKNGIYVISLDFGISIFNKKVLKF